VKKSIEVKERIIAATIELISESAGDVADINTRSIAEKAEVGVGMINYHFQTKERLIEICVERIIGDEISAFKPTGVKAAHTPVSRAKHTAKQVADFLFSNRAVSRISILSDMKNPKDADNTMRSVLGLESTIKELNLPEQERQLMAFALVSTMQALFLRPELFGMNMHSKEERDKTLDTLIDRIFAATV
jgi:AcrR family transcriptional regulator